MFFADNLKEVHHCFFSRLGGASKDNYYSLNCGLGSADTKKDININKLWQHNTQSLVATIWSDNSPVKTLSNYHQPEIIHAGMTRRKIGPDGVREKQQKPVDAPMQNAN